MPDWKSLFWGEEEEPDKLRQVVGEDVYKEMEPKFDPFKGDGFYDSQAMRDDEAIRGVADKWAKYVDGTQAYDRARTEFYKDPSNWHLDEESSTEVPLDFRERREAEASTYNDLPEGVASHFPPRDMEGPVGDWPLSVDRPMGVQLTESQYGQVAEGLGNELYQQQHGFDEWDENVMGDYFGAWDEDAT